MSDDYLWDKSGTPDPEIEELEQLLGNLRYRHPAGQLPLPKRTPVRPSRNLMPALAVAAAVLFVALAAGIWFVLGVGRQRETTGVSAINAEPGRARDWLHAASVSEMTTRPTDDEAAKSKPELVAISGSRNGRQRPAPVFRRREPPKNQLARASSPNRREAIDYDEGIAAREQLIKALHLASSKLNLVQKKIKDHKSLGPAS